jgi:SAM-dependent methyltransferase
MKNTRPDYGQLYDEKVAATYDEDSWGLLAGGRALAMDQIRRRGLPETTSVLDLGVGTGMSLCELAKAFPQGRKVGIDLSARMIASAREKLHFEAHVDDACNAGAHVAPGSIDLVLAHFLTTFVDRSKLFAVVAKTLAPGGLFSVVSTPGEAFGKVTGYAAALVGEDAIRAASPAPLTVDSLSDELRAAGFEICEVERFRRPIVFDGVDHLVKWGVTSGFFAHTFEVLGTERMTQLRAFAEGTGLFPLEDEYIAGVILASPARS